MKDWMSAGDTSDDYYKTWSDLHIAHWDGIRRPALPVLPLTPTKIHIIGALLKLGGYRSAKNYINVLKTRHVEEHGTWGADLALAHRRFTMSCERGMGPPRQSEPLNYEAILELDLKMDALVNKGPVNTKGMAVMNTMFMVRELEAALAMRKHIAMYQEMKLVTWELPVSKTDPRALGMQTHLGMLMLASTSSSWGLCVSCCRRTPR